MICATLALGSATTLQMASSTSVLFVSSSVVKFTNPNKNSVNKFGSNFRGSFAARKIYAISHNGSVSSCSSNGAIPEEIIEKPIGLSLAEKAIGKNPRCTDCQAKGAVLCTTCVGSGLYIDSVLESQGMIVKVRCLGCGGTGNILCTECGGRGHLGPK